MENKKALKDIESVLLEQIKKLSEINNAEPEQVRKNTETILFVYSALDREVNVL